ncbi:MAG: hypothetical protein DKM50_08080 [Candidatus Margulisiibacteriota bacterium]|nr:MAG: hypothetical protein A2X41_04690 [Candidatus Margulisbacteria bacterium GWE2_39_32]PZM79652.1 MAG: hypothetical protein DKM50_08080 [Candidatus Margulisiibacteriota bacterium]HCY36270.1 hypothetical protein [Candidatus Margulisiibacteriota bacterium]
MVIIFSLTCCLIGLAVAAYFYFSSTKPYSRNVSLLNKIELIRDGINVYHTWQVYSFSYYCIFFALLLTSIYYGFYNSISWQVPFAFIAGIIITALVIYLATFITLNTQKKMIMQQVGKTIFNQAFMGAATVGIMSVCLSFLGVLFIYSVFGVDFLVHYALGSSLVAVFSQINGGIFSKAFEIGSQIVKKESDKLKENDERNPSVWGERVSVCTVSVGGRISSMIMSYLFSLIGTIMVINQFSTLKQISKPLSQQLINYPFILFGVGILAVILGIAFSLVQFSYTPLQKIIWGMYLTIIITAATVFLVNYMYPLQILTKISINNQYSVFWSVILGLIGAIIVSIVSEYYGSSANAPVKDIAEKSQYSPVNTILGGFRVGMKSMFIPIISIGIVIYLANMVGGTFAIGLSGVGMLSIVGTIIAGHVYSAIINNAKVLNSMGQSSNELVREYNKLDSFGDTTHSVSLGYSSIISFLSSLIILLVLGLQLKDSFSMRYDYVAVFVIIGALVPYLFAYFIIKGINATSIKAYQQSYGQLKNIPYLMENKTTPDIKSLVKNVLRKAQVYTFAPSAFSLLFPLVIGLVYGKAMLFVFLLGSLVSGLLLVIIFTNTGGLLYNVKKYIEAGNFGGVGTPTYQSSTIASMLGTPIKDAIAPSIDVLIKVMFVFSLIISPLFG